MNTRFCKLLFLPTLNKFYIHTSKVNSSRIITSFGSLTDFLQFTTKLDFCKMSCANCESKIALEKDSATLRPSSKKNVIFIRRLRQYFIKARTIFVNRNGAELSPNGKTKKIYNFTINFHKNTR